VDADGDGSASEASGGDDCDDTDATIAPGAADIWYDGVCNPCDSDYKSELKIGSILNKSIEELWNSEEYQSLRKTHMTGERNLCFPCDRCPNGS